MSIAEEKHKSAVASMGCLRCIEIGYEDTPCELHHCGTFGGGRRDEMQVVGLCPEHHRWKLAIDKTGKDRRHIEERLLAYVAEHCGCESCKEVRKNEQA
jgi:hypothetical protein